MAKRKYYKNVSSNKFVTYLIVAGLLIVAIVIGVIYSANIKDKWEDLKQEAGIGGVVNGTPGEIIGTPNDEDFVFENVTLRYTPSSAANKIVSMNYQCYVSDEKLEEVALNKNARYGLDLLEYEKYIEVISEYETLEEYLLDKYNSGWDWLEKITHDNFWPDRNVTLDGKVSNILRVGSEGSILGVSSGEDGWYNLNVRYVPIFFIVIDDGREVDFELASLGGKSYEDISVSPSLTYLASKVVNAFGNATMPYNKELWDLCYSVVRMGCARTMYEDGEYAGPAFEDIWDALGDPGAFVPTVDTSKTLVLKVGQTGALPVSWDFPVLLNVLYHGDDVKNLDYMENYTIDQNGNVTAKKAGSYTCRVRILTTYYTFNIEITE